MKLLSMNSFGLVFLAIVLNPQACVDCECDGGTSEVKTIEERINEDIKYLEQIKDNPDMATIESIFVDELTCKNDDVKTANN